MTSHVLLWLKTVELWDIKINVVWKTTIVSLSVCRAFFIYNLYLRDKSHSFFWRYFVKKCTFFLKMAERWGINIYVVAIKDHYSPLECMSSFFLVIICICVTNHVLFLLTGRNLVKNTDISNFFSKRWNSGININVVWKTTIVPLSVCRALFSYNLYLRDKSCYFFCSENDIFL